MTKMFNYSAKSDANVIAVKEKVSQANNELVQAFLKNGGEVTVGKKQRKNKYRSKISRWNSSSY